MSTLKAANLFQSGMVLQRNKPLRIWGEATPGAEVTVRIQGVQASVTADESGAWLAELPALSASPGEVLEICAGGETVTCHDVAVGEVYVASGQSNMEFFLRYEKHKAEILPDCENDRIRFYDVPKVAYTGQNIDFDYHNVGFWRKANAENLDFFSAVGYYFARELEQALDVPVGIIGCSWGGTASAAWMRRDSAERLHRPEVARFAEFEQEVPDLRSHFSKLFLCDQGLAHWNPFYDFVMPRTPGPEEFGAFFAQSDMPDGADFTNLLLPEQNPGTLFEHMVMTIAPASVSGVLWYQGESDDNEEESVIRYAESMEALIADWRAVWQDEQLPFFLVQLPGFRSWGTTSNLHYAAIRADQQKVADRDEHVYLCSIADVGEEFDIHPKDKKTVGTRLALLAKKYLYGMDLAADAPVFASAVRDGATLTLTFLHGDGLHIAGESLNALEVSAEGRALEVSAVTEENRLILHLTQDIPSGTPVCINHARSAWYLVNLYNAAGLPAIPFHAEL